MQLQRIHPTWVDQVWPVVAEQLNKAIERSNGATLDALKEHAKRDTKQIWVALIDTPEQKNKVVGSAVTALVKREDGTQDMIIELLGGEQMDAWFSLKEQLEDWARSENRDAVEVWCRKALLRKLPDYKLTHYVLRKQL